MGGNNNSKEVAEQDMEVGILLVLVFTILGVVLGLAGCLFSCIRGYGCKELCPGTDLFLVNPSMGAIPHQPQAAPAQNGLTGMAAACNNFLKESPTEQPSPQLQETEDEQPKINAPDRKLADDQTVYVNVRVEDPQDAESTPYSASPQDAESTPYSASHLRLTSAIDIPSPSRARVSGASDSLPRRHIPFYYATHFANSSTSYVTLNRPLTTNPSCDQDPSSAIPAHPFDPSIPSTSTQNPTQNYLMGNTSRLVFYRNCNIGLQDIDLTNCPDQSEASHSAESDGVLYNGVTVSCPDCRRAGVECCCPFEDFGVLETDEEGFPKL